MNSICRDIFQAIHEGKWIQIEYKNKQGNTTKYWIGIRNLDVRKRTLSVEGLHLRRCTVEKFDTIFIDSILSSHIIDGSYCEINQELVKDISLNPHKYKTLFDHVANLKILNYLELCNKLDTVPYNSIFDLVSYLDNENIQISHNENGYKLSDEQFRKIVNTFQFKIENVKETDTRMRELGMNVLSIHTNKGLLSLVGDDRNLICIDFVCHGIPSKLAWEKYLEDINKSGSDIVASINMRDKSTGWSKLQYSFSITMKDGNIIKEKFPYNHYLRGFVSDYYLRPSCYDCKFKGVNRRTDITLGDYWGVWDIQPEMDDNKGTSLVLIHSEKGLNIFLSIIDDIISKEAILEKAITNNRSIVESAQYSDNRKVFFERIQKGDSFCKIIDDMTGYSLKSKIKNKTKKILKKIRLECQK